jgi:hypothetical protein
MKENTHEKSLVKINENSIFYKIKSFFKNLFHKSKEIRYDVSFEENISSSVERENQKSAFIKSVGNIENEETLILKLQKQYRNGEIKEEDLTEEQVDSLCSLYDIQIAKLKKSNEMRKAKLLEYRKNMKEDI